jgi:hypothetical protein
MITAVNTVLVSNAAAATGGAAVFYTGALTSIAAADKGKLVMVDQNGVAIATPASTSNYIKIGVIGDVTTTAAPNGTSVSVADIKWGAPIFKGTPGTSIASAYAAPANQVTTINLAGGAFEAAAGILHDFTVRVLYHDVETPNTEFTQTFYANDVTGTTATAVATAAATALAAAINKDKRSRITATAAAGVLTLTGKNVPDNGIDEYQLVEFDASFYEYVVGAFDVAAKTAVDGVTISTVPANYGVGYWQTVRDMENRYMGYTGMVFRGAEPEMVQPIVATSGNNYNRLSINFEQFYRSADNQYAKETPINYQIFAKGTLATVATALNTFMGAKLTETV